mmetsp:Transcript_15836/g.43808  ORF Transcript_15836/g.43808 Transcript_15836/m.43808 type:complete len:284 (-) Transcript_15836:430-1281(-)
MMNTTRSISRHATRRTLSVVVSNRSSSGCEEILCNSFRGMSTSTHYHNNNASYRQRDFEDEATPSSSVTQFSSLRGRCRSLIHATSPLSGFAPFSSHVRLFSTTGKGGDDNDDESLSSSSPAASPTYDPYEITKSFEDTSYYYPPSEELDPKFLAAKYEGMTNAELMDTSTISGQNNATAEEFTWDTLMHSPPVRDKNAALPKGSLVGKVVSTKMQKTVNVAVDRYKIHPKYRKRIKYTRKFMAHDEDEVASDGDTVLIVPSQRISKKKHFVLREIIRAKGQL